MNKAQTAEIDLLVLFQKYKKLNTLNIESKDFRKQERMTIDINQELATNRSNEIEEKIPQMMRLFTTITLTSPNRSLSNSLISRPNHILTKGI